MASRNRKGVGAQFGLALCILRASRVEWSSLLASVTTSTEEYFNIVDRPWLYLPSYAGPLILFMDSIVRLSQFAERRGLCHVSRHGVGYMVCLCRGAAFACGIAKRSPYAQHTDSSNSINVFLQCLQTFHNSRDAPNLPPPVP